MIEFDAVSKAFHQGSGRKLLRNHIGDLFRQRGRREFYALRDVSFRVDAGESVAFIGRNGAGKSTLLSLVAGLTEPTSGQATVRGRIAALLELGSGFHPDLTGVENLRLNASLLGLSRKRTDELFGAIAAFAEIGDFIYQPTRTYSAGMLMRLAFSVAIHVDPDILIVDEVLGVGDQGFQTKCHEKLHGFREAGKTLLFVSHSSGLVAQLCERAIWLEQGRVVMAGPVREVTGAYDAQYGKELVERG
jgi:ABC-type polysaccharide/polyol phosphate transport system ATPase subunit